MAYRRVHGVGTTRRELIDRVLDGRLDSILTERRSDGWSYQRIANELRDEHAIDVSDEVIRRWCSSEPVA